MKLNKNKSHLYTQCTKKEEAADQAWRLGKGSRMQYKERDAGSASDLRPVHGYLYVARQG